MAKPKTEEQAFFYIQQGGSSTEGYYPHGFNKRKEAVAHRGSAIRAAYLCGPIIPVAKKLADQPGFDDFIQKLIQEGIPS